MITNISSTNICHHKHRISEALNFTSTENFIWHQIDRTATSPRLLHCHLGSPCRSPPGVFTAWFYSFNPWHLPSKIKVLLISHICSLHLKTHHSAQTNFKKSRTNWTLQTSQNHSFLLSKILMLLAIAENGVQKVAIFLNPLLKKQLLYLQFFFLSFKHVFVKLAPSGRSLFSFTSIALHCFAQLSLS